MSHEKFIKFIPASGMIILFLLTFFTHFHILNVDVRGFHTWRQAQTMWNVRNFVRHDANIFNPRINSFNGGKDNIQRYEFPLLQYSIAIFQKVFGEKPIVFRLLMFFLAFFSLVGFYKLAFLCFNKALVAMLSTFSLAFSPCFFHYAYNPMPDGLALAGGIWYLYFLFKYKNSENLFDLVGASFSLLVATLSKLPFVMFSIVSIFLFIQYILNKRSLGKILVFCLIQILFILPALWWYLWVIQSWSGNPVLVGVFGNHLSNFEYFEILKYHKDIMFPRILLYPAIWLFFIFGVYYFFKNGSFRSEIISLVFISFLYLGLEFNAINTVHDYYLLPFLPWMFLIAGFGFLFINNLSPYINYFVFIVFLAYVPINTVNSTKERWSLENSFANQDVIKYRSELENIISNEEICIILNDKSTYIFSYYIDKMGHIFSDDYLPIDWIPDMIINHEVTHMYSDSRVIDQDAAFQKYVDTLLLEAGSIHVYKLKSKEDLRDR